MGQIAQASPVLARGALRLRRCGKPNAFGNALGGAFVDSMQPTDNRHLLNTVNKASDPDYYGSPVGMPAQWSGSGLTLSAEQANQWGPQFNLGDEEMSVDYSLGSGRLPTYVQSAQGNGANYSPGDELIARLREEQLSRAQMLATRSDSYSMSGDDEGKSWVDENGRYHVEINFHTGANAKGPDELAQARADAQSAYQGIQDRAVAEGNPFAFVGAKFGSLASEVGYDFAQMGRGAYRIATDSNARSAAGEQLQYLATHPMAPVVGAIYAGIDFANKPFDQQADSLFKGGLSLLAGTGATKVVTTAGGLAWQGAGKTAQWLAPAVDDMVFNHLDRMGLIMRIVPDGPSVIPGLRGSGTVLGQNIGGTMLEGYQNHHLVMSSLATESSTLRFLAKEGLYDINRASNGLRLPSKDFLAIADDLPLHSGFHGNEYRLAVRNQLARLDAAYDAGLSNAQLLQRVSLIEKTLATDLKGGKLWLNDADAALRKLGPFAR
jgi:hypothetical protein